MNTVVLNNKEKHKQTLVDQKTNICMQVELRLGNIVIR